VGFRYEFWRNPGGGILRMGQVGLDSGEQAENEDRNKVF
jgi:hypothetical protein